VQIELAHMHIGMSVGHGLVLHSCRSGVEGKPDANVTQICPTAQSLLAAQLGALATTLLHVWLSQRAKIACPVIETMLPSSAVVAWKHPRPRQFGTQLRYAFSAALNAASVPLWMAIETVPQQSL
jgi:hypothetical protein